MLREGWCDSSPSNLNPSPNPNQVRRLSFGRDKSKPKETGGGMSRSMSFGSKSTRKAADTNAVPVGASPPPPSSSLSPKSAGGAEPDQEGMSDLELSNYLEHLERNHEKEMEAFHREQK